MIKQKSMNAGLVLSIVLVYFIILLLVSYFTSKGASNNSFFIGNKKSPWFVVAFGMIGALLSGVTFISVPGWVGDSSFYYMQMVIGYFFGYLVIAYILVPIYYKMNLTSIYTYLDNRFDVFAYKTGASLFLISRIVGASFRLFLVANVLHLSVFSSWNVPFWITVVATIIFIWLYTFKGGIKTIIWTDMLQTLFMLTAATLTVVFISKEMGLNFSGLIEKISESEYSKTWNFTNWKASNHFLKQFFSGAFIAIVMTGLDQDMMQKSLSCKNARDSQKNMITFSLGLIPVNLLFLSLGVLLFMYAAQMNIPVPEQADNLFPLIALGGYLPQIVGILFIIGLIAAAYSSADSALTALTTSFTIDILGTKEKEEDELKKVRKLVHLGISLLLLIVILVFHQINNESVISSLFKVAGYTYGPLLGLYSFGIFTSWKVNGKFIPIISLVAPLLCFFLNKYSEQIFNGYQIGYELLIINGFITFIFLLAIRKE